MCVNLRNIIILHCPFASSFWLIALKAFGWSLTFSSNVFAILHLFWWANRFCGRRKLLWLAIVQAPFTSFRWKKWSHFQGSLLFLISLWTWFFLLFPIGAKNKHLLVFIPYLNYGVIQCSEFYFPFHLTTKLFLCPKKGVREKRTKIQVKKKRHLECETPFFKFLTWQTLFQILIKEILLSGLKSAPTLHIWYIYPTF